MTNFVRRKVYARSAPPPADQDNIDGVMAMDFDVPHILPPHITAANVYQLIVNDLTDAADGGTGFHNAWGEGDPDWDETPDPEDGSETALEDLLGAFPATWQHVEPDVAGSIILNDGSRWEPTVDVTQYLYFEAPYANTDEPTAAIRELAAYLNLTPTGGHEADPYLPEANISALGDFLALDRIAIVSRSASTSGKVRIVLRVGHA
jgi:hypothetical protein